MHRSAPSRGHSPPTARRDPWAGDVAASGLSTHRCPPFSARVKGTQNFSHTNMNIKVVSATGTTQSLKIMCYQKDQQNLVPGMWASVQPQRSNPGGSSACASLSRQ